MFNFKDRFENVGKMFNNNNGNIYIILYYNSELDRNLLLDQKNQTYIVASCLDFERKDWCYGHYFLKDFEGAVNYVLGKEED